MRKLSKLLFFVLTLSLVMSVGSLTAWANSAAITVTVRVESGEEGAEKTLLPIMFATFGADVKNPTVTDALMQATQNRVEVEKSEYGEVISAILGVSDDTGRYAWMYAVNNENPPVSADVCEIKDGDEIVFYFSDWQETSYSYFDKSVVEVDKGEEFTLNLTGLSFTDGKFAVDGAQIISTGDQPRPRIMYNTDEDGQVT
jgi:hypothetical protein